MSRRLLALLTALVLLLAACADGASDSDTATADPTQDAGGDTGGDADDGVTAGEPDAAATVPQGESADDGDADASEADGFGSDVTADEVAQEEPAEPADRPQAEAIPIFLGRQIIKTGDIVLEAADVAATTDAVIDTVFDNGGAIWGQETTTDPTPRAVLTIRVPPLEFDQLIAAITRVPGVGVVSENTTSDDVTEVVVDLDARIIAAESSVARVQALLDDARDLDTIFRLEEELATRQADLERLLGQRKTIGDQVALSTITLTILELDPDRLQPEMDVVAWLGDDADDACPGRSSLSMGADDAAVLCISVNNTGEDALSGIDVESSTLRLRVDDFEVQAGTATLDRIEPGDELLLTVELDAEGGAVNRVDLSEGTNIAVEVAATPATSEGLELTADDTVFLSASGDDPLPGFTDSFASGWQAMIAVVSILMIVVGALLPFVPVIALAVWLGRRYVLVQRRRAEEFG